MNIGLDFGGDDSRIGRTALVQPQVIIYAPSKILTSEVEAKPEAPAINNRRDSSASAHRSVFQVRDSKGRFSSATKCTTSEAKKTQRSLLNDKLGVSEFDDTPGPFQRAHSMASPQTPTPDPANGIRRRSSLAALVNIAHQADFEDQASDIFDLLVGDVVPPPGQRPSSLSKSKKWLKQRPKSRHEGPASDDGSLYQLPIPRRRQSTSETRPEWTPVEKPSGQSASLKDNMTSTADDGSPKRTSRSAKTTLLVQKTPNQADETDLFFDALEGDMEQDTVDESVYLTPDDIPGTITKKAPLSTPSIVRTRPTAAVDYPILPKTSRAGSPPEINHPNTSRCRVSSLLSPTSTRMRRNKAADFFEKVENASLGVVSPSAVQQHSQEDSIADDLISELAAGMWAQPDELNQDPTAASQTVLPSSLQGQEVVQALTVSLNDSVNTERVAKKENARGRPTKSPFFKPPIPVRKSKVTITIVEPYKDGIFEVNSTPTTPKKPRSTPSASPNKRSPGGLVSCIPFPPLASATFGLIQEKLAHDPFRLLIAVTFLNRTRGKQAIPVFYNLVEKYPTPELLAVAKKEDIVEIIRHLGLQNQRAGTYLQYARQWIADPPTKDKRYPVRGYPEYNSGRDIKKGETITDLDTRIAWEIGHMTQGPYAIDSWRIFCRDVLRGIATGWNGEGVKEQDGFQPEWMRVMPEDKELRAYLRWMWLKEGFEWDPFTGDKEVAGEELMRAAQEGRIAWDDLGGMRILGDEMDDHEHTPKQQVAAPDIKGKKKESRAEIISSQPEDQADEGE